MRALNEGSGFDPERSLGCTDRAMRAWYNSSIACMTFNRRVTWQATSDDENS
jgi:hypothetical protein